MKHLRFSCIVLFLVLAGFPALFAQATFTGMSFNGSTGLYSIPSGRISWENASNLGLDVGYHTIIRDGHATHIPKVALSIFRWVELSGALDVQPDEYFGIEDGDDFLGGIKIRLPLTRTALSLGGSYHAMNFQNEDYDYSVKQIYAAVTYVGSFFDMPAETTVVFGKSFVNDRSDSNIDFGMGFDLVLLPNIFEGFVRWVTDFSNFSYSHEAFGVDAFHRGVVNTGFRIDLSRLPPLSDFKAVIDIVMTDAFDSGRSFSAGFVFGIPVL